MAGPAARTLRFYLLYTPLWIAGIGLLMVSHAFAAWRDLGHMLLGLAMAAPIWLAPLWLEPGAPLGQRYSVKAALYITLQSLLQNYFGTPFFVRCFGLEYHFPVTLLGNGFPIFLSFVTVAYFSTYFAVIGVVVGAVQRALPPSMLGSLRRPLLLLLTAGLCYLLALAETYFMASELLRGYFAYADKQRMMWLGSLGYGSSLLIAVLPFLAIDDEAAAPTALGTVAWQSLGANTLVLCAYEIYAALLAPLR